MKKNPSTHLYFLACITAILLWSASFIATKIAYQTFAPIQLGIVRTAYTFMI